MSLSYFLHFGSASLTLFLSACGTGIGQGIAGAHALDSMTRQTLGTNQAFRAMIIGLAIMESGGIFALVLSLLLIFSSTPDITLAIATSEVGIALAMGIASAIVGISSSFTVAAACKSIMRQPFFSQKIMTTMLLSQSIIEAPVIFAFIISLMIKNYSSPSLTLFSAFRLLSSGLVIGIGSIGPAIGQAIFSSSAQKAIGNNLSAYKNIFTFMLLNQAVIETPVIFSLLVSFLIIYFPCTDSLVSAFAFLSAALCMGMGSIGTGIANGYVGSSGCSEISLNPNVYPAILRATLLSQAIIEAPVIYTFIVALLLITRS